MTLGTDLITEERTHQITVKGYTPEHDAQHTDDDLVWAAASYLLTGRMQIDDEDFSARCWPWEDTWNPSKDPIANLTKAGALIAAEIDRLHRKKTDLYTEFIQEDTGHSFTSEDICTCGLEWHTDRCARWCETNDPASWCSECRSYA